MRLNRSYRELDPPSIRCKHSGNVRREKKDSEAPDRIKGRSGVGLDCRTKGIIPEVLKSYSSKWRMEHWKEEKADYQAGC
jgi:hypothetical protein